MSDLPHYLSIIMHYQSWWIGHFVHGGFWLYGLNDNPEQELRSSLIIIDICSLFFIFLPGLIFITLLYLSGRKKPGVYRTDVDLVAAPGKSFVQSSWISYSAELLPSPLWFFFFIIIIINTKIQAHSRSCANIHWLFVVWFFLLHQSRVWNRS